MKLRILTLDQWLDGIGCDRAYKKQMKPVYKKCEKELEAQARETAKQIYELFKTHIVRDNEVTYWGLKAFYDELRQLAEGK